MDKRYKISYKTYLNERLKEVHFHGRSTYPLYIQITFDRKTIIFKSYYFELFSKPRYAIFLNGLHGPSINDIVKKEYEVIDYVIDKTIEDFSLENFKKEYAYYSTDLYDTMETGFVDYLYNFFRDKGMPSLATTIQQGLKYRVAYDVVREFKISFNSVLYEELVSNSFYLAPPYFPLYDFMVETQSGSTLNFSVMNWEDRKTQDQFINFFLKKYPTHQVQNTLSDINRWMEYLRKSNV